jgi:hypothetical protein
MFRFFNANKFGYNIEDCTIRAVSVAEGISWDKAYIKLSDYARKRGLMLNSVTSIESYLDDNYERICEDNMTVGEFAHYNPIGTYLITMLGHITTIKDGEIIDTFDCSDRIMWCAWCVE